MWGNDIYCWLIIFMLGGAAGKKLPLLVNDMYIYVYNEGGGRRRQKITIVG